MQTPSKIAYRKISTRSFVATVLVACASLVSDKSVSELHAPAGVTMSDIKIRYHADRAHNNKTGLLKDSAHLRMMSLSIAMTSLLPDVEDDRARGLR